MDKMSFGFDKYIVEFPKTLRFEIFDDGRCKGIKFHKDGAVYQLVHNKVDWNRIIINKKDGAWMDLPFNPNTWSFLPEGVSIVEEYYARTKPRE
jgi:hypothetical protein